VRRRRHRAALALRGGDHAQDTDLLLALEAGSEHFAEALDYFPDFAKANFESSAERYLSIVAADEGAGRHPDHRQPQRDVVGGWVRYAKLLEEAGADAIELNLYRVAADPAASSSQVEADDLAVVHAVSEALASRSP
jgi:dihydroorotate dehydrogenase (fumarate)